MQNIKDELLLTALTVNSPTEEVKYKGSPNKEDQDQTYPDSPVSFGRKLPSFGGFSGIKPIKCESISSEVPVEEDGTNKTWADDDGEDPFYEYFDSTRSERREAGIEESLVIME